MTERVGDGGDYGEVGDEAAEPIGPVVTDAGTTEAGVVGPPPSPSTAPSRGGFLAGRSELVVAGLVLAMAIYLTVGIITMEVPPGAQAPGPKFFPTIIAGCAYVLSVMLIIQAFRHPEPPDMSTADESQPAHRFHSDWKAMGLCIGGFALFALLLNPLGWILSAALLFWTIARAMGSKRPVFDIGVALVFSSAVQLAFSAGLGLNLPAGILGGLL